MFAGIVFYLTEICFIAWFLCWVVRLVEGKLVGVKSDFWDVYPACFLSLIGITASTNLLYIVLGQIWTLYLFLRVITVFVVFLILLRVMLKHSLGRSIVLAITASVAMWGLLLGLSMIGVEL